MRERLNRAGRVLTGQKGKATNVPLTMRDLHFPA